MNMHMNSSNIILSPVSTNGSNQTVLLPDNKGLLAQPIPTPQQEIDIIRGKSAAIDVDKANGSQSTTFSILLLIMAIFFSSN